MRTTAWLALLLAACGGEGGTTDAATSIASARLIVRATAGGSPTACKVTIRATDAPRLVLHDPADAEGHVGRWLDQEVVAVDDTVVAAQCEVSVSVPPGRYTVTVSRGPESEAPSRDVELTDDDEETIEVELEATVDSTGWACADLHVHSAPSIDSDVPLEQRLISAVAEGLDLMAATDHDALGDWSEALVVTGLEGRLVVVPGNEISPGVGPGESQKGHFNVYPVPTDLVLPDAMPHAGLTVEQILAGARTAAPGAILQINHPRSDPWFGYFSIIDFDPVTGTGRAGMLASDFDALEVWNGHGLDLGDREPPIDDILEDWYALLSAGRGVIATGSSDTHRLARSPVGFPRTCVRVADDAALDMEAFVDGLRIGDAFVTSGPFLDVTVQSQGLGAMVTPDADGTIEVAVHVQAPGWVPVDRVHVVLDGGDADVLELDELPASVVTRVPVSRDGFVVVIARADTPLGDAAGSPLEPMPSMAFSNPVFVDADGDGVWAPPSR